MCRTSAHSTACRSSAATSSWSPMTRARSRTSPWPSRSRSAPCPRARGSPRRARWMSRVAGSPKVDAVSAPVLSVYTIDSAPRLAWDTRVTGNDGKEYSSQSVYVDALTGAVLGTQEHVMHGTGNSGWNGPVTIATTHSGSNFLLRDPAHPTEQCQNAANNTTFTKTTDTWGNGNPTNRETGCTDATFVIQTENRTLTQWLG